MPSIEHEALLDLFRSEPKLAAELIRGASDIRIPEADKGRVIESTLTEVVPTVRLADLVLAFGDDVRVVVEVQTSRDTEKRWSWPVYQAALQARHRCRVYLLIVTNSPQMVAWVHGQLEADEVELKARAFVIGPGSTPRITDLKIARKLPHLTLLSAMLPKGREPDLEVALAALVAVQGLDSGRATLYGDLVLQSMGDAAQHLLEAMMSITELDYEFKSNFARKYYGRGLEEGEVIGLEKGRRTEAARAVLTILSKRKLPLTDEQRATILGTTDLDTLTQWIGRSVDTSSTEELLKSVPERNGK